MMLQVVRDEKAHVGLDEDSRHIWFLMPIALSISCVVNADRPCIGQPGLDIVSCPLRLTEGSAVTCSK